MICILLKIITPVKSLNNLKERENKVLEKINSAYQKQTCGFDVEVVSNGSKFELTILSKSNVKVCIVRSEYLWSEERIDDATLDVGKLDLEFNYDIFEFGKKQELENLCDGKFGELYQFLESQKFVEDSYDILLRQGYLPLDLGIHIEEVESETYRDIFSSGNTPIMNEEILNSISEFERQSSKKEKSDNDLSYT